VLVPIVADPDGAEPREVEVQTAELLAKITELGAIDVVPTVMTEPISLNARKTSVSSSSGSTFAR